MANPTKSSLGFHLFLLLMLILILIGVALIMYGSALNSMPIHIKQVNYNLARLPHV